VPQPGLLGCRSFQGIDLLLQGFVGFTHRQAGPAHDLTHELIGWYVVLKARSGGLGIARLIHVVDGELVIVLFGAKTTQPWQTKHHNISHTDTDIAFGARAALGPGEHLVLIDSEARKADFSHPQQHAALRATRADRGMIGSDARGLQRNNA
jgi:hypothetical protein